LVLGVVSEALQLADVAEVLAFATLFVIHGLDAHVFSAVLLELVGCLISDLTAGLARSPCLLRLLDGPAMWNGSGYRMFERIHKSLHSLFGNVYTHGQIRLLGLHKLL
jgi:hypothetical protein